MLAQNNVANTIEQQLAALKELGGLSALGSPKVDNIYHAGWAWAGSTPLKSISLSYFGRAPFKSNGKIKKVQVEL